MFYALTGKVMTYQQRDGHWAHSGVQSLPIIGVMLQS